MSKPQVLIKNDKFLATDIGEKQLLNEWPRGAYTTARTVGINKILEFELHVGRLVESARLMIEAHKGPEPAHAGIITNVKKLRPYIMRSVSSALREFQKNYPDCTNERRITCLLTWGNSDSGDTNASDWPSEFELYSHVHILPNRPVPPIRVDIRGAPRGNAKAKDTQWVHERKSLEAMMGSDVNEVLLVDEEGFILEGTQTNFFAVLHGTVYTAGEGVLEGSIRKMVLEECHAVGIPVVLKPPRASDMEHWEGAFITSTSRLVLPIDAIHWPEGPMGPQIREFQQQPLTQQILALVMAKLDADSVLIENAPQLNTAPS